MKKQRSISAAVGAVLLGLYGLTPASADAQNTVSFNAADAGQTKSLAEWGVDTALNLFDNVRLSVANMGRTTSMWCG